MRRKEGEKGQDFKIRSTFENDLGHFTHEKDLLLKDLNDLVIDQQNDIETRFIELNATLDGHIKPKMNQKDPLLANTLSSLSRTPLTRKEMMRMMTFLSNPLK